MTPICPCVGSSPMANVATPMIRSVRTRIVLRPSRSPKWPKIMLPNGRAKKPTAKVLKAARVPATGSKLGKKSCPKTSPAAVL